MEKWFVQKDLQNTSLVYLDFLNVKDSVEGVIATKYKLVVDVLTNKKLWQIILIQYWINHTEVVYI